MLLGTTNNVRNERVMRAYIKLKILTHNNM